MMTKKLAGLYLVTPDWDDTQRLLDVSELGLQGGASILQYRHKTADATLRLEQASALHALCRRYQCPFIINDHVDLCLTLDADGIHVGGTDASVAQVRALVGLDKIVGASCYGDLTLAQTAHQLSQSYSAIESTPRQTPLKIAVVAHGGVLECIYRLAHQLPLNAAREAPMLNASINRLSITKHQFRVMSWGDVAHLENALDEL